VNGIEMNAAYRREGEGTDSAGQRVHVVYVVPQAAGAFCCVTCHLPCLSVYMFMRVTYWY